MKEIINQLKSTKKKEVLIVGDILLDEYITGSVDRISSEAPIPVVKEQHHDYCVGGAGNTAVNCLDIGFKTTVVSIINDSDFAGQKIITLLKQAKVLANGLVKSCERRTTHKKRVVAKNQQLLCLDSEDTKPLTRSEFRSVCEKIDLLLKPGMIVLISDYDRGFIVPELISYIVKRSEQFNCLLMADPSGPDYLKYKNIHYIKPNLKEFNEMLCCFNLKRSNDVVKAGIEICRLLNCKGLFITMGENGIQFVSPESTSHSSAQVKEIFGLAGAGDTVFAYLALGLSSNLPIPTCLRLANKAAAIAISHVRTYSVCLDELIDKDVEFTEKIFTEWSYLKIELDWQCLGRKTVVFTNGCFDILHAGHVYLLKEAKKLGHILVVGLNSDESIKKLGKSCDRPINSFINRANIIAALGVVDFVVKFDDVSPISLLEYLKPDVFVKGSDYTPESNQINRLSKNFVDECEVVKMYGGVVKTVQLVPELSTSNILKKIKSSLI